ncbi:unnamed protein product [Angiostrongylus costaricensis]|uniref:Glutaminase n=1 Tax=Angiostrongylus costaricensis TaxID=334426 RepID=A0A0R3PQH1_ANGCS|nr:unnamed protein product [Angiostrongylus costaricensis]
MVYSTAANVPVQVAGIANSEGGAQAFVSRLVMQAVVDVLERQGRSAGLSDAIISLILGQLTVQVRYTPLQCMTVAVNPPANMPCTCITSSPVVRRVTRAGAGKSSIFFYCLHEQPSEFCSFWRLVEHHIF